MYSWNAFIKKAGMIQMRNTKSILKILILLSVMVLAFSNPTVASNGIKDRVLSIPLDQRIYYESTISASKVSKIQFGIGQAPYEKDAETFVRPYGVNLFIDGQEIKTYSFSLNDKEGFLVGEPVHWWIYYHVFEAGYFQPNTAHTFGVEYFWYNGYGWYDAGGTIVFRNLEAYSAYNLPFYVTN